MNIRDLIQKTLDLLLPQRCLSCKRKGAIICEECLYRLPKESSPYGITTLFAYSDRTVQKAIWLLKYKGIREVAKPLARVTYERLIEDLSSLTELSLLKSGKIILIPVPLSKEKQKERGFNQSAILAEEIINLDNSRSLELRTDILIKIRDTQSQVSIKNRTERLKNLNKAFVIEKREVIEDKIIVLLDDVTTTGATLNECAKVLRKAKPRQIIKVAMAH